MKNNKIGAVSVESLGRKKERHSFTHDVNTTCSFTDVHPLQCVLLPAKTRSVVRTESLIRLDPIVAPTFGRLEYKTWHYFVNMTDLTRNFSQLLTQKRVSRGNGVEFMPKKLPSMPLCLISSLVLMESHCTIWHAVSYIGAKSHKWELLSSRANLDIYSDLFAAGFAQNNLFTPQSAQDRFDGYQGWGLNLRRILPDDVFKWASDGTTISNGLPFDIPLNNPSVNLDISSFFDWRDNSDNVITNYGGIDVAPVQLESADYVICKEFTKSIDGQQVTNKYAFAFRLSDFGKRIRKILLGLGYQIDFTNTKVKSLMPLFAFFKAYYSTFGILQYMNWEDTAAAKLLSIYDNSNTFNFIAGFANRNYSSQSQWRDDIEGQIRQYWFKFVEDLSFAYTTDAQDWVSSHTRSFAVAERVDGSGAGIYFDSDYPGVGGTQGGALATNTPQKPQLNEGGSGEVIGSGEPNNHAYIDRVLHGQLDSEILKTLYLQTNLQTIAGQRVAELLRLKGLGDWMDVQNVRFIGQNTVNLNIKDVTTTSDTLKTAADGVTVESGASVGSWGANGLGYGKSKAFKYENDEVGFWVTLCAVVPSSGYCQAVLPSLDCIDATSFYDPAFDGAGYEATAKEKVCGALDWADMTQLQFNDGKGYLENTFGYTPRESGLKIHPNVANGDFSLRSLRTPLLPYFFDKFFELGERDFANHATAGSGATLKTTVDDIEVFEPSELPIAGDLWRFTARFDWLGKLSRIFAIAGDPYGAYNVDRIVGWLDDIDFRQFVPYFRESVDGFKCQNIIYFDAYAPMLQIADSYETLKDGNEGHVSERIGKA